jgi:DNA adenine methylase
MELKMNIKILNREGSKFKHLPNLLPLFPEHNTYIEPFLGTGAVFFNKPLVKYNLLNDHCDFIYNLWLIFKEERVEQLVKDIENTFIYTKVLIYDKKDIASQILLLMCMLYQGCHTLALGSWSHKDLLISRIYEFRHHIFNMLSDVLITNMDSIKFIKNLRWQTFTTSKTFIYCDPPYSISKGMLQANKNWSVDKLKELIELLLSKKVKFGISELNDPQILELIENYKLNYVVIGDNTLNKSKGNNKKEIYIANYDLKEKEQQMEFFSEN